MSSSNDLMSKIISLSKRRGFIFQSSEIYGGLKSAYDYGPLGTELKRNIAQEWWKNIVYERDNVFGMDASILMHSNVWKASGHLASFSDPLVDCLNCKERFRADKQPQRPVGSEVQYVEISKTGSRTTKTGTVGPQGYVCPNCSSPVLSPERQFRGMFKTTMGPIDPLGDFVETYGDQQLEKKELKEKLFEISERGAVYLRPETAQAMFVQFQNVQQTCSAKIPFGIAQIGKSFRNEIVVEHFIFRSCEFEQMELEFFCEPGSQKEWLEYWKEQRIGWHRSFANNKDAYRLRQHEKNELAHYSDSCFDIEYKYPWGFDELEGIASRTDYDLKKHSEHSGVKLSYFDQNKCAPGSDKPGWRYTPYVIEPSAGLTRTLLCYLLDAYHEEVGVDHSGAEKTRTVLRLHPKLAPIKAAVLPLVKKDGQPEAGQKVAALLRKKGVLTNYDDNQSIGKRYAKHDEIGTPFCLSIDQETLSDEKVTLRDRDTTQQRRLPIEEAVQIIKSALE